MRGSLRNYLQIIRLPNVFTAMADIFAGHFIIFQGIEYISFFLTLASSSALYTGGMVLNDYFDSAIDMAERPNRPIPSGRIKRNTAGILGMILITTGIILPLFISRVSFGIAILIAALVISYNAFTKFIKIAGPVNMGLCRYMNFMLGMSPALTVFSFKMAIPLILMIYILTLTVISSKEAGNIRIQRVMKYLLIGIIPLDAVIASIWAGPAYGAIVLMLIVPTLVSSRILYMT